MLMRYLPELFGFEVKARSLYQKTDYISLLVDASILNPPMPFKVFPAGEARPLVNLQEEMPPNLPSAIVATDQLIEQRPQAVAAYLKGYYEAVRYMRQNRDYSIDYLMNYTKQDRAVEEREYDEVIMKMSEDGNIEPQWMQDSLELATLGTGMTLPPLDQMYTSRFIPVKLD